MSLELFEAIIIKAKREEYSQIFLFNWNEPFLCENLYEYMNLIYKYDFPERIVSSNLSLESISHFDEFLHSRFTKMIVTVSGFTQEIYEKYHRNGRIDWVKKNLEYIADFKLKMPEICGDVVVRYLVFDYNHNEIALFRNYVSNDLDLGFEIVTADRYWDDNDSIDFLKFFEKYSDVCAKPKKMCWCTEQGLQCDVNGDVYICCKLPTLSFFKIGNFLTDDDISLRINKLLNPYCDICDNFKIFDGKKILPVPNDVCEELMRRLNNGEIKNID
jgi:hypothetical protein